MLPTFVIGLREGLEAALIVGIIAAFLRKQGRRDLLRWMFIGVASAVLLCVAAGVLLNVFSRDLPQKQQEGLETVIGVLAVGMVTYMVVWMKRHSRGLKSQLEGMAASAIEGRSSTGARAMVAMAFLAVLREGVETVVFLLAAFNQSDSGLSAPVGALLGILVALALGYGIYRGGVRINLSKFFRATGLVLVLVAAGLVVNALHTAHEAGWLNAGQGGTLDLSALVRPGSVQASLLTGMLGLQSHPVLIEVVGWLVYLVPVGLFVAWPPGRGLARPVAARALLATAATLAVAAGVLGLLAPAAPGAGAVTTSGDRSLSATMTGRRAVLTGDGAAQTLTRTGSAEHSGVATDVYAAATAGPATGEPASVDYGRLARLNGGNLPIGLTPSGPSARLRYVDTVTTTAWLDPRTGRVVDLRSRSVVTATVLDPSRGALPLARPVSTATSALPAADVAAAADRARADADTAAQRSLLIGLAWTLAGLALVALLSGLVLARRGHPVTARTPATPSPELVRS